jgi:hypothetical protein
VEQNKSAAEMVEELSNNLYRMNEAGILHENIIIQIDDLISTIYAEENKKVNEECGNVDPDDEEYCPSNTTFEVFSHVEKDVQDQFAKDYQNIINMSIHSDQYIFNYDEAIEKIILMRS